MVLGVKAESLIEMVLSAGAVVAEPGEGGVCVAFIFLAVLVVAAAGFKTEPNPV
jgi:hypothetical protein